MMVADIKNGFQHLLQVASWMDNVTLNTALDKLSGMLNFVGYPDELRQNITAVDEEYSEVWCWSLCCRRSDLPMV